MVRNRAHRHTNTQHGESTKKHNTHFSSTHTRETASHRTSTLRYESRDALRAAHAEERVGIVVCEDKDVEGATGSSDGVKGGLRIVTPQWVFECVSHFAVLP
jgi:hypothetical protein